MCLHVGVVEPNNCYCRPLCAASAHRGKRYISVARFARGFRTRFPVDVTRYRGAVYNENVVRRSVCRLSVVYTTGVNGSGTSEMKLFFARTTVLRHYTRVKNPYARLPHVSLHVRRLTRVITAYGF